MITLIAFFVVISLVVVFHEFGHFWVAMREGVKVKEFAIGFGPILFSKRRGEVLYSLRLLPLGGFVRLFGESPEESGEGSFLDSSPWSRLKIISAGPLMNLFLAIIVFFFVFLFNGYPNLDICKIGSVLPGSPAERAGLKAGDEVLTIDGVRVSRWEELAKMIHENPGRKIELRVLRGKDELTLEVTPEYSPAHKVGLIGVTPWMERFNPLGSLYYSSRYTFGVSYLMLSAIGKTLLRKEKLDIRGPVAVAQLAGQAAKTGWVNLLSFIGIISVNLAFINLFPLPALDGGRLVFILFELIFGRRLDPKHESTIHYIGFLVLIALMLLVTYHDVISLR